jgi:hypothetical protein
MRHWVQTPVASPPLKKRKLLRCHPEELGLYMQLDSIKLCPTAKTI